MADGKRKHPRTGTSLAVDVRIASRSDTSLVRFSGLAQAKDVGLAGLKLRMQALDPELILACARHEMLVLMTVHLSASESLHFTAEVKWAQNTAGSDALLGVEYKDADAATCEKIVAWSQRMDAPPETSFRGWRIAAAVVALLLGVQTVRLFTSEGTPEKQAMERLSQSSKAKAQARANKHETASDGAPATPLGTTAQTPSPSGGSNYKVLDLAPKAQEKLQSFQDEPRDEKWAKPAEQSFKRDFDKLLSKLDPIKQRAWGVQMDSLECRRTKCLAKMKSKGFGQWMAFVEDSVYKQGFLDAGMLPFEMKCTPVPIQNNVQGAVPNTMDYEASLMLDCHKPVYAPMPPPPDPSKDRLLNPELQHLLPDKIRQNPEAFIPKAQARYAKEQAEWDAEKARRNDPNFLRVEPNVH